MPSRTFCIFGSKLQMCTWYILIFNWYKVLLFSSTRVFLKIHCNNNLFYLYRYADNVCSGKISCEISTPTLILHSQPCPLELSSYFETSYRCVSGIKILSIIFLQSFANEVCSGMQSCEIRVHDLIPYFKPCPVELSSFMETSYQCLSGKMKMYCICKAMFKSRFIWCNR